MIDFEKAIEGVALRLGTLPEQKPKNLFDILGVRNKETINSKILGYFLDVNETHGLQSLFFDSLKTIIEEKSYSSTEFLECFNGEFKVINEDTTNFAENETKKRIDISLMGNDKWGIIIENKLYHDVVNPLKAYWEHTQKTCGDSIIGVLLTLFNLDLQDDKLEIDVKGRKVTYLNITHKEWVEEIQKQLNIGEVQNLEGLLYLKEYIKTIQSHYNSKMEESTYNALAFSITKHRKEIEEIQHKIAQTTKFIDQQINEAFAIFGYEKKGNWYTNIDAIYPVYFYVTNATEILMQNKLWFTLEVRNEINKKLRENNSQKAIEPYFQPITAMYKNVCVGNQSGKNHTHITIATIENAINENNDFKTVLIEILGNCFMGEKGLVKETENFIQSHNLL
ncbi:hypothetical protein FLA105534_02046 [Flavobacterium bizetiae]|uniref:PD-(D/E)XK nuclease superfamily protein n=1 Tax=Flavobacterium bizetiae TaxID=2704140 RepID=A0A6J4GGE7_9FLAO|nr:PD-(D/E)XK nuclease family protein [Flavobacterium bizetiae]CAA9198270.1 hypothetical protein FLA105534_02046 [Flavobacterium bizetiae]CAD5343549.1 hypothetical protein FLA105535_03548 [Flavobacterium bizetiae]CAD5349543.1 hypothetical protein FLA105534_03528 [Flavobacterium bizetiae]